MSAVATEKSFRNQLFINGEFVDAKGGKTFPTINPATEEKITDVAAGGSEDVDAAVRAARGQMEPGSEWQKMKPRDRAKVLWRIADMLSARAEEWGLRIGLAMVLTLFVFATWNDLVSLEIFKHFRTLIG